MLINVHLIFFILKIFDRLAVTYRTGSKEFKKATVPLSYFSVSKAFKKQGCLVYTFAIKWLK